MTRCKRKTGGEGDGNFAVEHSYRRALMWYPLGRARWIGMMVVPGSARVGHAMSGPATVGGYELKTKSFSFRKWPRAEKERLMSILPWRGPAVLVVLIGVTLLSQNASAQPRCPPGQIESGGRCRAPAWICVSKNPQGTWGRGWSNNRDTAIQRALDECNRRGLGCSTPTCKSSRG